jgi:hypothetical protein
MQVYVGKVHPQNNKIPVCCRLLQSHNSRDSSRNTFSLNKEIASSPFTYVVYGILPCDAFTLRCTSLKLQQSIMS